MPGNLVALPLKIFMLRRGPLLGPILQHSDDIDFVRCLFLNVGFEDCKRIIQPQLMMGFLNQEGFWNVPMADLALQSDKILFLDHHTHIFIWSGSLTIDNHDFEIIGENCASMAKNILKQRFPIPEILSFKEGSSMARWLQ